MPAFESLQQQKNKQDAARRQSLSDQQAKGGVFSQLFHKYVGSNLPFAAWLVAAANEAAQDANMRPAATSAATPSNANHLHAPTIARWPVPSARGLHTCLITLLYISAMRNGRD